MTRQNVQHTGEAQVATTTNSSTATATMMCQNAQRTGEVQVLESADHLPQKGEGGWVSSEMEQLNGTEWNGMR